MMTFLFSPVGKWFMVACGVIVLYIGYQGWLAHRTSVDIQKGIDQQRAAEVAASNQNIAERRIRDATFDKLDAAAVCAKYDLKWVYANDKSHCE